MYLRDTYFTGNEDLYYGPEMVATMIASAGTATFRSFNMGSEINASEIARYERDITFESRNDTKTLFRGERANVVPDDVFQNGFKPMGTHNDALLHTKSNATAGNFVSTSGDKAIATEFASNNGYVYVILADNYFDTLIKLREELEKSNIKLLCRGCCKNVYPSGMLLCMGAGRNAYTLIYGEQARTDSLVDIFASCSVDEYATIEEQLEYFEEWTHSLRR